MLSFGFSSLGKRKEKRHANAVLRVYTKDLRNRLHEELQSAQRAPPPPGEQLSACNIAAANQGSSIHIR